MPSGRLTRLVLLALGLFVTVLAVQHLIEPGLSSTQNMISEYANTGSGVVMEIAFAAWGVSWVLLALIFVRRRWWVTAAAAVVAAAGATLITAFSTQAVAGHVPAGVARTVAGRLHDLGGELLLGGALLAAATTMVACLCGGTPLRGGGTALLVAALIVVGGLLALGDPAPGLRHRVLVAAAVGWQVLAVLDDGARRRTPAK